MGIFKEHSARHLKHEYEIAALISESGYAFQTVRGWRKEVEGAFDRGEPVWGIVLDELRRGVELARSLAAADKNNANKSRSVYEAEMRLVLDLASAAFGTRTGLPKSIAEVVRGYNDLQLNTDGRQPKGRKRGDRSGKTEC